MNEIETKLIVYSSHPEQTVQRVAKLRSLSGYVLLPQPSLNITDRYLDLADNQLAERGLGFRVRVANGETFVALKGPSELNAHGVSERLEIEAAWSVAALRAILDELHSREVETGDMPDLSASRNPVDLLSKMGFMEIQKRKNNRIVRNVVSRYNTGIVLAELVIDSLTFYAGGQEVHHTEVEIEAKSAEGAELLGTITADLRDMFPADLKEWPHSKLAIGMTVEELTADELNSLLDGDQNLKPEAYARIEEVIRLKSA